jgi:hypothetical protein
MSLNISPALIDTFLRQVQRHLVPDETMHQENALGEHDLLRARTNVSREEAQEMSAHIVAGVDYGDEITHLIVLGSLPEISHDASILIHCEEIRAQGASEFSDVNRVAELAEQFHFDAIVDDPNGLGADRHRILIKLCAGIPVYGGLFDTAAYTRKDTEPARPALKDDRIIVPKVYAVRGVLRAIRNGRLLIRDQMNNLATLEKHLSAMYIGVRSRGSYDVVQPSVEHRHDEDHYFSALIYARLALWRIQNEKR